jgi:hypothetical protein
MSETPQETVTKWLREQERGIYPIRISVREAIRAVLAENASVSRAAGYLSDLATWWVAKAEQAEAERDALRAEVERLREELALECELVNLQAGDAFRAERERIALQTEVEGLWVIRDDAKSSQERMRLELVRLDTLARERGEEVERLQDLASDAGTRCGIESLKGKP